MEVWTCSEVAMMVTINIALLISRTTPEMYYLVLDIVFIEV